MNEAMQSARGRGIANLLTICQARTTNRAYIGSEMGFLTPPPPFTNSNMPCDITLPPPSFVPLNMNEGNFNHGVSTTDQFRGKTGNHSTIDVDNEKSIEVTVTDDSFTIDNNYMDDDDMQDEIEIQELVKFCQLPNEYFGSLIDDSDDDDDEKSIKIANNYKEDDITHDEIQKQKLLHPFQQPIKGKTAAYLSHYDNPGSFFLQHKSTYSELKKLQDNLQIVAGTLPHLKSFIDGAMCIALYSVDQTWYRARIIDSETSVIQYIDYGNTDVITNNSYIKEINEALENINPFAIPCALPIAPKTTTVDCIDDANIIFNNLFNKTIYIDYVAKSPMKNYVNINIDGQDLSEKLIGDDIARRLEVVKSGKKCVISHINNLSDFYIHMKQDIDILKEINEIIEFEDFEDLPFPDYIPGIVCAAIFPDDLQWYRAKILTHSDRGTEVLFIDYGNTAMTTEIRAISPEIANLPLLSKKCTLRMPDNILGWSELAEKQFKIISGLGVFRVELKEPGDHAIVDLFIGDTNILELLKPLCD